MQTKHEHTRTHTHTHTHCCSTFWQSWQITLKLILYPLAFPMHHYQHVGVKSDSLSVPHFSGDQYAANNCKQPWRQSITQPPCTWQTYVETVAPLLWTTRFGLVATRFLGVWLRRGIQQWAPSRRQNVSYNGSSKEQTPFIFKFIRLTAITTVVIICSNKGTSLATLEHRSCYFGLMHSQDVMNRWVL